MTGYDSEHDDATDSGVGDGLAGAGRVVERNAFALKVTAFYAVALAAGVAARRLVHGPTVDVLLSIAIWFTIIFAVCTAALGAFVKVVDAVQRRRTNTV
ncbi:hypothetical protein [Halobacterium yunchengense]|uniref:hypothetical protein n=1 Tax=Halobacterium yunchengense TaxID=3108497 RepID=UPI003009FFF6